VAWSGMAVFTLTSAACSGSHSSQESDRDAISVLLTILRCGTPLAEVQRLAPGLDMCRLSTAYATLEKARARAVTAWEYIEEHPTSASLWEYAERASLVLPVVTHTILSKTMRPDSATVALGVAEASAEVHRVRVLALGVEASLDALDPGDPKGVDLGAQLYNPVNPGIYGSAYYLPDRVASLTPLRVRDLLGEPRR
jgi:hypothetical protein